MTCQTFASHHNLTSGIDENPVKSKTKCMAFLKKKINLRHSILNNKIIPWVNSVKHLGTVITNDRNKTAQDTLEKRAQYIAKNNELVQEFNYASPTTKILLNNIFNTHFYGATLWDLLSAPLQHIEKSWNTSQRIMMGLPRTTHRYLIEPLSGRSHIICSIWTRFLKFTRKLKESKKTIIRNVFNSVKIVTADR